MRANSRLTAKGRATRARIIDAAARLMHENGAANTTNVDTYAGAVAARDDGGVVLSGDGIGNRGRYFLLAALRPDGRRDPTIGAGGFAKAKVGPESNAPALVLHGKTAIAIGYTTKPHSEVRRTLLARVRLSP